MKNHLTVIPSLRRVGDELSTRRPEEVLAPESRHFASYGLRHDGRHLTRGAFEIGFMLLRSSSRNGVWRPGIPRWQDLRYSMASKRGGRRLFRR